MVLYSFWIQGSGTTRELSVSHLGFTLLTGRALITVVLYLSFNLFFQSISLIHKACFEFPSCHLIALVASTESVRIIFNLSASN